MREDIPDSIVVKQADMNKAIQLCINASGLEEKEIYIPLGIDSGHWTRICKGQNAHFPPNKLGPLMDLCGNEVPLRWLAMHRGYDLKRREDEKDRMIRERDERIQKLEAELQTVIKYGLAGKVRAEW